MAEFVLSHRDTALLEIGVVGKLSQCATNRYIVFNIRSRTPAAMNGAYTVIAKPLRLLSNMTVKGKGSPYSITERRVPELIPVLGSQPAGDVSHKPGGRLPLLCARPAVTLATLKRAATSFAAW